MRHSLFLKYSQSQNYHYTKGINEIMAGQRTPTTILFKDLQHFDHAEETLNKCYSPSAWDKLKMLGEYYKVSCPSPYLLPSSSTTTSRACSCSPQSSPSTTTTTKKGGSSTSASLA